MSGETIWGAVILLYVGAGLPLMVYQRRPNLPIPDANLARWEVKDRRMTLMRALWVVGLFALLAVWRLTA